MKVHESIDIAAEPETVWSQIADPQHMAGWHAKLVEVQRSARGPVYVGERFGTTYVMSDEKSRRQVADTEVLRCEPGTTLVLRHHIQTEKRSGYVDETFQLLSLAEGRETRVEHTVDFANAGFPVWVRAILWGMPLSVRALMWLVARSAKPQGEGILDPLKRACEVGGK